LDVGFSPKEEGRAVAVQVLFRLAAITLVATSVMVISWAPAQEQDRAAANDKDHASATAKDKETPESEDPFARLRNRMVERHLVGRGIKNPRVLEVFRTVPRHKFLPRQSQRRGYEDESIPIAEGQTLTAPYDVAYMTEILNPKPTDRVYEVGTGSGYQSAILSRLVKEVYSVEIHAALAKSAAAVHKELGYTNIHTRVGDGYEGWPEAAPFDAVIVTCAPQKIPAPLFEQLKEGGRMVIPLGDRFMQSVHLVQKRNGKRVDKELKPTLFVPMTGRALEEAARAKRAKDDSKNAASKGEPQKD
jgi:protein-L-isoaspartate(D-aspartate) O-methyltransferase